MKNLFRLTTSLLVVMLLAATAAMAEPQTSPSPGPSGRPWMKGQGQGQHHRGPFADLNLTAEQKEKMRPIMEKHRAAMKAERETFQAKMKSILTPEQQQKMEQAMAQRRANRGQGRGSGQATPAPGQTPTPGQGPGQGQMGRRQHPMADLNLTDAQRTEMRTIRQQHMQRMQTLQDQFAADVKPILTAEQQTKFEQTMQERRARMQQMQQRGQGQGRRRGPGGSANPGATPSP